MSGGNNEKDPLQTSVEKTHNKILAKKEAKLSKDALMEKRATQLTKHFIRSREQQEQAQLRAQAERSKQNYERSIQKVRDSAETAAALGQIVQEEKEVIWDYMMEKGRQREEAELQAKKEKEEREKWKQARMLHEKFQAEERARKQQEKEKERLEKAQAKMEVHDALLKERLTELDAQMKEAEQKRKLAAEKVRERQRTAYKELRQAARLSIEDVSRKQKEAEKRRNEAQQQVADKYKAHMDHVMAQVEDAERRREEVRQARHQKILDKARSFEYKNGPKDQDTEQQDDDVSEGSHGNERNGKSREIERARAAAPQEVQAEEKKDDAENAKKPEDGAGPSSPRFTYNSKEVVEANMRAKKEYWRQNHKLQEARAKMEQSKKFTKLADDALSKDDDIANAEHTRLRTLHTTYIMQGKGKAGGSPGGSQTARTPRQALRIHKCGLCEREFPHDALVGNAKQSVLSKIKQDQTTKIRFSVAELVKPNNSEFSHTRTSVELEQFVPGAKLYDRDVAVCASCFHTVRTWRNP